MRKHFVLLALAAACFAALPSAFAQKAKSQKEAEALMAIQNATDAETRLKSIDAFLATFAESEFKIPVLVMAVQTAQQTGNYPLLAAWGDRALQADPKNYLTMVVLAEAIATHTREFDLDRDEKLAKADKYSHEAMEILADAPKFRATMTDAEWEAAKKDFISQAHEALGMTATVRKQYPAAIEEYKTSIQVAATPDYATWVRLGEAYSKNRQYDEATAAYDKAIAAPEASAQVKQAAQQAKAIAARLKAAGTAAPKP